MIRHLQGISHQAKLPRVSDYIQWNQEHFSNRVTMIPVGWTSLCPLLCQYLSLIFEVDCENIFLVILFESVWRRWKAADDTTKIIQLHLVSTMPGSRLQPLLQLCDAAYNSLNTTQIWFGSPAEFRNPNPWFMMLAVSEAGEVRDIWREYRVRPALRQPTVQKALSNL